MKLNTRLTVLIILVAVAVTAAPLGTEFTYQGFLSDGGTPATGTFDFRFFVYDADAGGSQVGVMVLVENLTVTDGRLTAQLDFGSVFDGTALWLEVGVRDGSSTGAYTVLSPRQELTAAPFAQHAETASHALTAGDAGTLGGQAGSYYLAWSNLVGVPPGLLDDDDDTLADLACAEDEIARWNGSAWVCSADDDTPFIRTYVVGPVGTPLENGAALQQAMGTISPLPSEILPALLKIEPGIYDFGTGFLDLFPWMVIEGAGRDHTRITSAFCSTSVYSGTFSSDPLRDHAVLRNLTVENTCGEAASRSVAFSNQADFLTLDHVTLIANGAALNNTAMYNWGGDLSITDSTLSALNGTASDQGLVNMGDGAELFNVFIEVVGGTLAQGIDNDSQGLKFKQGRIWVGWGSDEITGIYNDTDANNLYVTDSKISVVGSAPVEQGIYIKGADATLRNVEVNGIVAVTQDSFSASFASLQLFDVYASAAETALLVMDRFGAGCMAMIDDGRYNAGTDAVVNVADACDVRIGGAYLANGVTGAALCAGVYDWGHTFYPNTCPP